MESDKAYVAKLLPQLEDKVVQLERRILHFKSITGQYKDELKKSPRYRSHYLGVVWRRYLAFKGSLQMRHPYYHKIDMNAELSS